MDNLYAVVGSDLYKIDINGTATSVGTLSTDIGKVWIVGGTTHLMLVDGIYGYYQESTDTSLTTITDADFPSNPTSVTNMDGYYVVTEEGTDSFYISALDDASSWDALDFASAEDTPDDALVVMKQNRDLWVFGEQTTEVYYNSGDTDFPFTRVAGGVFDEGLGAVASVGRDAGGTCFYGYG